ncbi:MAG TPA: DEAD/DEAH box helicase family protein [Candidatus Saccharimonadales bacterium]|nr:DEAD/DEAH box helicase family protein [Candidatus Saccharimonadales bacterium]
MAEARGQTPAVDLLPHRVVVEEVIGVPLLPAVPYEVLPAEPGEPADIRVTVQDMIMDSVRSVLGRRHMTPDKGDGGAAGSFTSGQYEKLQTKANDVITAARRQIVVANNVASSIDRPLFVPAGADSMDSPRAMLQEEIGRRIYGFIQRPHSPRLPEEYAAKGPLARLQSGLLIGSATATGKTVPLATTAERAGVGLPYSETDTQKQRMLLIVPSVDLLREYTSPDGTLAQWLPGKKFGVYYHKKKEIGGDLDIIVDESVPEALASGAINLEDYPIRVIDEGHHAGAANMLKQVGELATGKLILCTATPNRVKRYFVDFTASTARSAAEMGITRPVQILTYQFGPEPHAAEKLAARVASRIIGTGRQVGIYCRPLRGKPNAQQARDIVSLVNAADILLPEGMEDVPKGEYARVIAGVSGEKANEAAEADYRAGKLRAYAAIGMLGEGVNVPMDALIIVGPRRNQDQLDQIAGRLPRPLMGRPELADKPGILIELQPRELSEGDGPLASCWRTYGLEDTEIIEQAMYVGALTEDDEAEFAASEGISGVVADIDAEAAAAAGDSQAAGDGAGTAGAPGTGASGEPRTRWGNPRLGRRSPRQDTILDELAGDGLEAFLAPPVALREVTIARADWNRYSKPAEGSMSLSAMAQQYNVPEVWLRRQLDMLAAKRDDITYVGVRSAAVATEGRGEFERWYSPATVAYMEANPPASLPGEAPVMDITDIAEMLGVSRSYIETVLEYIKRDDGIPLPFQTLLGKTNRPTIHYGLAEIAKIEKEVNKTPMAGLTEVALWDLSQETTPNHVYNYTRTAKNKVTVLDRRRRPESGVSGFARHVSAEDAERVREAFFNPPLPQANEISLVDMALRAGMTLGGMMDRIERIPEEQRPSTFPRKTNKKGRYATFMALEDAEPIIEAARAYALEADRVTLTMLDRYFQSNRKALTMLIDDLVAKGTLTPEQGATRLVNLGGQVGTVATWGWDVMQTLEEHGVRLRPGREAVQYDLVARGPYDPDWQYSQQVQAGLIGTSRLAAMPGRDKLRHVGQTHHLGAEAITVEEYAATRNIRVQDVFAVVANGTLPDEVPLYYRDSDRPGNPVYFIDGTDVRVFDRHFRPERLTAATVEAEVPAPAPAPAPAVRPDTAPATASKTPERPQPQKAASETKPFPDDVPTMALDEIAAQSGRSPGAVQNCIRQLGLEDDVRAGKLRAEDGEQVVLLLGGGKRAKQAAAPQTAGTAPTAAETPAAENAAAPTAVTPQAAAPPLTSPPAVTTVKSTTKAAAPPPETKEPAASGRAEGTTSDIVWRDLSEVLAELKSTASAFAILNRDIHFNPPRVRTSVDGEPVPPQINAQLIPRLRQAIHTLRPFDSTGWMTHERLAENMGVEPNKLVEYMRTNGVMPGERDVRVRRHSLTGTVELMYSENRWKKVLLTKSHRK